MKRNLLITSAAAALIAGTMFAAAQGVQKQAPAGATEPGAQGQGQMPNQGQGKGKAQSKQQPQTQGQGGQSGQAQGQPGQPDKGKSKSKDPQTQGQGGQGNQSGQSQTQRDRSGSQPNAQPSQQNQSQTPRNGQKGAESKGGGSGSVTLTTEQRTKIRTTVLQGGSAPRVTNVNFSINVGTVVPRSVHVVAVPALLIDIHPEWRGFRYFIVGEQIIIIDESHHIVAVLVV